MRITRVLNENVLVKVKKEKDLSLHTMLLDSGIYLPANDHDWVEAEIMMTGDGSYAVDGKTWISTKHLKPGMKVLFEKEFHHVYDAKDRNRINHTVKVDEDSDYIYYVTVAQDIKFEIMGNEGDLRFVGELYPTLAPKPISLK